MKKLLVLLAAAALFLLAGEGVLSLCFGRSLRRLGHPPAPFEALDPAGSEAPAPGSGPYHVPADPLVGYTLRPRSTLDFDEGKLSMQLATDELGLRRRPGPEPPAGALRVAVLGDSVAFGLGLADDETLAAQLEASLAPAPGGRAVACFTVAVPSWNATNAWRFLLDHLDVLRPDVVLYLPVDNDLEDGYGVTEAGLRRVAEDPGSALPLLHVRPPIAYLVLRTKELRAAGEDPVAHLGPEALTAGLSATSRERYARIARTIAHGAQRLARSGARFALVPYEQSEFHRELAAELLRQGVEVPTIPLLTTLAPEDRLAVDPHPSPETVGVFARWLAQGLQELGWLLPGAEPLAPSVPERYEARHATLPAPDELRAWSAERRAHLAHALEPRIRTADIQGMQQLYGGLNLDGTLASECAAVLPAGRELVVRLEPLARPDLYPLRVSVLVDGQRVGEVELGPTGPAEARFALDGAARTQPFELRLSAPDWAVLTVRGKSWVACARLVELESVP